MRTIRVIQVMALVGGSLAASALADRPVSTLSLSPAEQAIHDAAAIKEPGLRDQALRHAVQDGLSSPDKTTRETVLLYLRRNAYWLELLALRSLVSEVARAQGLDLGCIFADLDVSVLPEPARSRLYQQAVAQGSAPTSGGCALTRYVAINAAMAEGLAELLPTIRENYDKLPPQYRSAVPYLMIVAAMELRSGGHDRRDAVHRGVGKLSAFPDGDLNERLTSDKGFAFAVISLATDACAANPFTGDRDPSCEEMRDIVARQDRLIKEQRKPRMAVEGGVVDGAAGSGWWLKELHSGVRYGELPAGAVSDRRPLPR